MGFFEGAQNFEVNGGNFIDIRGGQIQYTMNSSMNITGNNNRAEMNPIFNPGAQSMVYNAPSYGPTRSNTHTYPGYAQTNSPHTNRSDTYTHHPHTDPPHPNPPYNSTMYPAAEQRNVYYNYQACHFMQAQYQNGQQPYPYPLQHGQQPYPHPPQPGQQPYPHPPQPGQQLYPHPPQHDQQPYHYPLQQQTATTVDQYQQVFQNSNVGTQHHRNRTPSPSVDSEDPEVAEIRQNLARQDLS